MRMRPATFTNVAAARKRAAAWAKNNRPRLRFCLRMTVAAVMAYGLAHMFTLPLEGIWAVLTAVVVTQVSLGGSLRATFEYVAGTLFGAVYASAVGLLFPHTGTLALAAALAISVAPLAFAASLSPMFRVAPFTALMVLLLSREFGDAPVESALYRLLEVALGGVCAVVVSLWLFPDRAHGLGVDEAARILRQLALAVRQLLRGFTQKIDPGEVQHTQDELGRAVAAFQALVAEAHGERLMGFVPQADPGPLSRTLLRLRHDLVLIGRAAAEPLPAMLAERLEAPLRSVAAACSRYLAAASRALASRASPPSLASVTAALAGYNAEIAVLRREGLTRSLSTVELERLFALTFVLDQLEQHLGDLGRCVKEHADRPRTDATGTSAPPDSTDGVGEPATERSAPRPGEKVT